MPIAIFTESKTGILPKNDDTLDNVVSKLAGFEVDVDNADKIVEQAGIKIVELSVTLIGDDGAEEIGSIAKEEGCSLVDDVVDTSVSDT